MFTFDMPPLQDFVTFNVLTKACTVYLSSISTAFTFESFYLFCKHFLCVSYLLCQLIVDIFDSFFCNTAGNSRLSIVKNLVSGVIVSFLLNSGVFGGVSSVSTRMLMPPIFWVFGPFFSSEAASSSLVTSSSVVASPGHLYIMLAAFESRASMLEILGVVET